MKGRYKTKQREIDQAGVRKLILSDVDFKRHDEQILIEVYDLACLIYFSMLRMMRAYVPYALGLDGITKIGDPLLSVSHLVRLLLIKKSI